MTNSHVIVRRVYLEPVFIGTVAAAREDGFDLLAAYIIEKKHLFLQGEDYFSILMLD